MRYLILLMTAAAAAQAQPPPAEARPGGVRVSGWSGHIDDGASKAGMTLTDVLFESIADGFRITAGPAAYYWSSANVGRGAYTVKATFIQRAPTAQPEAYGLFIGGSKLGTPGRNYLYCIVFGTGIYSIKHQYGSENHTLVNLKPSNAVRKVDAAGRASNEVAWRVTPERVSCLINGTEVENFARPDLLGPGKLESTDGIYGVRVNHNLSVDVTGLTLLRP
ncbi:MAG: hypothetical protein ACT4OZ_16775 [Gemmatimonadota bacterium]